MRISPPVVSLSLAALTAMAAPASAQIQIQRRVIINGNVIQGGGNAADDPSVYVRDSGVAVEKLDLAAKLERQKAWDKAADVYQEIAQKFADRVVPSRKDDQGKPLQYVSAARVVQDRIAQWPADGLNAFRRRFEDTARDLLNTAGENPQAATTVMNLYFVTDAGRDAALGVMASNFENGEFAAAAAVGHRLLDLHPSIDAIRPSVLMQTALADHLAGRDEPAKKALDELKTRFADALVRIAGEDHNAANILEIALTKPAAPAAGYRSDDWPAPFGNTAASAVPEQISSGGARLFGVELPSTAVRGNNGAGAMSMYRVQVKQNRQSGMLTGVLPAIDSGALYFQDNAHLWAISLSSGLPLPGWLQTYPGEKHGAFSIDATTTPLGKQLAVSVGPQGVIALMGQYDAIAGQSIGGNGQPPQLVCLDRQTGRRTWSTTAQRMAVPDSQNNLHDGVFYGTPVIDGDNVYVLLNANRGNQFEECYVVALRLSDGKFRWASYVASTSRMIEVDAGGQIDAASNAAISLSNGRLFVLTNLGAAACLDTTDGTMQWLNVYTQPTKKGDRARPFMRGMPSPEKPFALTPPVVVDGRVFVMPADSQSIFVYDAIDGSPIRELPRNLGDTRPIIQSIVGVVGDWLVLANKQTIFRVPWKTFDPAKSLIDNDCRFKDLPPAEGDDSKLVDSIRGRPLLASDTILVTTAERLYRISLKSFKTEAVYPAQGKWDDEESPGNIIATPENLIVAGPTRVVAYADLTVATRKLDARLSNDSGDVDAYLRYAELLFAAGNPKPALVKLDQAADKLGGLKNLPAGPMRDRLFEIAANFSAKLQKSSADSVVIAELFDRAAAAADSPLQQVRYRLSRAAFERAGNRVPEEVALEQQILSNPAWRTTAVAGRQGPSTAGIEAESAIAELIRLNGASIYATNEAAAAEKLATLKQTAPPDADALLALADEYPLASLTPDILSLAADRFEAAHQPRRATQTLRQLLRRDLSNERRNVVLQALARNYLQVPNQVATAQVRLRQAKDRAPLAKLISPLTMPDGKPLAATTVAEALTAIDAYRTESQRTALPTLGDPPDKADPDKLPTLKASTEIAAAAGIISQQTDIARNDRVVVYGVDHRVGVVEADSANVRWTEAAPAESPVGCGFVGDTLVIVAPGETSAVDNNGKLLWKTTAASLPVLEASATAATTPNPTPDDVNQGNGPNQVAQPFQRGLQGLPPNVIRQIMRRRNAGRFGNPVIDQPEDELVAGAEKFVQYRLLSDRVVVATSTGRVMAVDVATGATAWQSRVSELAVGRLLSNDDFVVASFADPATGSDVYVFDAVTGQTLVHKAYDGNTNPQAGGLINLALSPDGVLVTMLAGRLIGNDLYEPGSEWKRDPSPTNPGDTPFLASSFDGQLVITGDRVLAVYNARNAQQPSVHIFELRELKPLTTADPRAADVGFSARAYDPEGHPLTVTANGRMFYVTGHRSLSAYDLDHLDHAGAMWDNSQGSGDRMPTLDMTLTQDFVLMVSSATPSGNNAAPDKLPSVRLSLYSRAITPKGVESGVITARPILRDSAGLLTNEWQVVNHAFYYVSADQKLKVVRVNP